VLVKTSITPDLMRAWEWAS